MRDRYNLLIDVGNTFVKWGRYRVAGNGSADDNVIEAGHCLIAEMPDLAVLWKKHPAPHRTVISNVAGTRARSTLIRVLEIWPGATPAHWLVAQPEQCGVTNGYRNPAQLGSDRWAAVIGARGIVGARPVLVVVCGTATTIDFVNAAGEFTGGVILPGVGMMIRSLHEGTAALPDADGEYADNPKQTVDAIVTGCQHAQAGAVERLHRLHQARHPDLVCLISGGAGKALAPRLSIPFRYQENLVLEGLHRIASTLS
ncbi:MAG: type III pantothenate kinase [Burkholderiales bacterium]|nr:type III pantothenate kinase [Burkholderiales bacterium]